MTYHVELQQSHHQFEVEGKETILRAGMRQGLNLAHSCMNGTCGECIARLVSGEISECRSHDFKLTELQKIEGQFLTCCCRAGSDLILDMHELHDATEVPYQEIIVKVAKLERLQDEVMQLHLRASRSQVLDFLAGQRVQLCLADGMCLDLGIASCPCDGLNIRFHIRLGNDAFSQIIFEQLKKGTKLQIKGPSGEFTLNEDSSRPIIFLAWETGFAQVQSIIDHVISINPEREMTLYWLSAITRGHYLSNYCRSWRDVLDNFYYESVDLEPVGNETFDSSLDALFRQQNNINQFDIYAILPPEQLQLFKLRLDKLGFAQSQLVSEAMGLF